MTQHHPAAPTPYSALRPSSPPAFGGEKRPRRVRLLPIITLVVAVAAAVMAGIALARQPSSSGDVAQQPVSTSSVSAPAPSAAEAAMAKKNACDGWNAASAAMVSARQPFINAPASWDDPITVNALAQAQSGILTQVAYLRQRVAPVTPREVAGPIDDYIAANIDLVGLDGQHQSAAIANAAADRGAVAAAKIRAACGIS
jgi:hypothetical protein